MATTIAVFSAAAVEPPVGIAGAGLPAIPSNYVDVPAAGTGTQPPQNAPPLSMNTQALDFPQSTTVTYYADFKTHMPQGYTSGTTINARIKWRSTSSTGVAALGLQMKAIRDALASALTRAFAAAVESTSLTPPASGTIEETTLSLTSAGSNLDSVAAGDHVRFRLYRKANDTMPAPVGFFELALEFG